MRIKYWDTVGIRRQGLGRLLILLYLLISMAACGAGPTTSLPPAVTPSPPIVTEAPTITTMVVPARTATFTVIPTHTAIPTDELDDPTPGPTALAYSAAWLQGIPCRAPCWQGLVPGQTTVDQALQRLQQDPLISIAEIRPEALFRGFGFVSWSGVDPWIDGEAYYFLQATPQTIYAISPQVIEPFPLAEVIKLYGEPSHAVGYRGQAVENATIRSYTLRLVFLDHGLMIQTSGRVSPTFTPDLEFKQVVFFDRVQAAATDGQPYFPGRISALVPWQSFQAFSFYCRQEENPAHRPCSGE